MFISVEACKASDCIADTSTVRQILKGKAIVLYYNQKVIDEENWEQPYKTQAKFMYIPIATSAVENNMIKLTLGELKTSEELLRPFYDWNEKQDQLFWLERAQSTIYAGDDDKIISAVTIEQNMDLHRIVMKAENSAFYQLGIFGGFAIVLYMILRELESCCSKSKFENYLAAELFQVNSGQKASTVKPAEDGEEEGEKKSAGGCCGGGDANAGLMRKRTMLPKEFHNEIYDRDEMILDHRRMGGCKKFCFMFLCCCSSKRQADKVFAKARMLASQELNVTSIVKAQRQTAALASLAKGDDVEEIKKAVKRVIEVLDADLDVSETARRLKEAQSTGGDDENPKDVDETKKPED